MTQQIGFIGLGIMGRPMAANLLKKGCDLLVYDINPLVVAEFQRMGAAAGSPAQIGAACKWIFTILPNGPIVQEVLLGPGGVSSTLQPGSIVVDMSSVTPQDARACERALAAIPAGFLDAPVSGGEPKAIDGTLAFMVGGLAADFEQALPYFNMMGASATLVGPCGSGCIAKLANQIIVNLNITALAEALVFASKAGVDPQKVYQAIRGGLAGSTVMEAKAPMMIQRNFKPGGKLSINLKDIKNVMATAHALDVPLPFTSQLLEVMQALKVDGHLEDDHSAIVQYFENLAGVQVQAPDLETDQTALKPPTR
jgi:2-hydroxy-3-oxopropionate reductase